MNLLSVIANDDSASKPKSRMEKFVNSVKNTEKEEDDSSHSFADKLVPTFGDPAYSAPPPAYSQGPEPSAPPLDENESKDYQQWQSIQAIAHRKRHPKHHEWHEHLKTGGSAQQGINPVIKLDELPRDMLSEDFLQAVRHQDGQKEEFRFFTGNGDPLPTYTQMSIYTPGEVIAAADADKHSEKDSDVDSEFVVVQQEFSKNLIEDNPTQNSNNDTHKKIKSNTKPFEIGQRDLHGENYDEIASMIRDTDKDSKTLYANPMKVVVPRNNFIILADKKGLGANFQIWGGGFRVSLVGSHKNQVIDYVHGKETFVPFTTDYEHLPNRCTIIRINLNEIGFLLSKNEGTKIRKILPGRYFIKEANFGYIGKAEIKASDQAIIVKAHENCKERAIVELASKIKIVNVPLQHVAFVKHQNRTYVLPHREEPYILDERRGEFFLNISSTNEQLIKARDNSYTIIKLSPSSYVIFQYNANEYVWQHSPENEDLNTIHLPSSFFTFDGRVHSTLEERVDGKSLSVISPKPAKSLVLRDLNRNIRFMEESARQLIVLRKPWELVEIIPSSQALYQCGPIAEGCNVTRAVLKSNEWALTINKEGSLQFVAPLLDGPQYFRQPEQAMHAIVDKTKVGEQSFEIPGFGKVSVVNLVSGTIGACRVKNAYFFLGMSLEPYIFSPPNQYIETIDATKPHCHVGDLHRLYVKSNELAAINRDGQFIQLGIENQDKDVKNFENGIYIYRARDLELIGPFKRGIAHAELGPVHIINVDVGTIGYGYVNKQLTTWGPGEHIIDNRKNERFKGFFSTSVDPVKISNFPVTSLHAVTSHVNIYVSYSIENANLALASFSTDDDKPHDSIHDYVKSIAEAQMLKICQKKPPSGYTEQDFGIEGSLLLEKPNRSDMAEEAEEPIDKSFEKILRLKLELHGIKLNDMEITNWVVDEEFKKKTQEISMKLQDEHFKNEQQKILLARTKMETTQKIAEMTGKVEIAKEESKIKLQTMDISKQENILLAQQEAELKAAKQIAEANADAATVKAKALGKMEEQRVQLLMEQAAAESARVVAQKAIETEELNQQLATIRRNAGRENTLYEVETGVQKETAGAVARAKADAQIAESQLGAAKATAAVARVKADTEKYKGLVEAEVSTAKNLAVNPELSPGERVQLQIEQMRLEMVKHLAEAMLRSNITMPGFVQINPQMLEMLGLQGVSQTTTNGPVTITTARNPSVVSNLLGGVFHQPGAAPQSTANSNNSNANASISELK